MSLTEIILNHIIWGGLLSIPSVGLGLLYKRHLDKKEGYRW
jgi:hypothetical protein